MGVAQIVEGAWLAHGGRDCWEPDTLSEVGAAKQAAASPREQEPVGVGWVLLHMAGDVDQATNRGTASFLRLRGVFGGLPGCRGRFPANRVVTALPLIRVVARQSDDHIVHGTCPSIRRHRCTDNGRWFPVTGGVVASVPGGITITTPTISKTAQHRTRNLGWDVTRIISPFHPPHLPQRAITAQWAKGTTTRSLRTTRVSRHGCIRRRGR